MTGRGARKEGANRANRLSVTSDNPADVGLPQLQPENDHAAVGNLREHNLVWEFDELADDKLEELSHAFELSDALARCPICASRFGFASAFRKRTPTRAAPLSSEGLREPGVNAPGYRQKVCVNRGDAPG
jgi:hypothetical protein